MLEDRRIVFRRPVGSSYEKESGFVYLYNRLTNTNLGKRPLDGEGGQPCHEDDERRWKSPKTQSSGEADEIEEAPERPIYFDGYFSDPCLPIGNSGDADEILDLSLKSHHLGSNSYDSDSLIENKEEADDISESLEQSNCSNGGDHHDYDSDPLIGPLGWEMSINCLLHCSLSDYGNIASLNRSFHRLVRSSELYKLRHKEGVVEHLVYFSCNVHQWDAFNPNCRRWMHLPSLPPNECFMCSDKESLAVGCELLLFGREVMSQIVFKYSILTNSWSSGAEMYTPRFLFASASLREVAIVAGGCDTQGVIYDSAELYNSHTQAWMPLPSMNIPRKNCSGFFMDGQFYVVGGVNDNGSVTSGEVFTLETKSWCVIPDMFPAGSVSTGAPPLVAVVNNQLYAADHAEKELRRYDKNNNTWIAVGKLPERSVSVNGWGLAFRACGESLIVIGGQRTPTSGNIELYSWIPSDKPVEWELIARKPSGSFVYNCAVMSC